MKVTELIAKLTEVRLIHGDLDVVMDYEDTSGYANYLLRDRMLSLESRESSVYVDDVPVNDLTHLVLAIRANGASGA